MLSIHFKRDPRGMRPTFILIGLLSLGCLPLVAQPSYEDMTKTDKPPAGYQPTAPTGTAEVKRLPDTPMVTPGTGLPGMVNADGTVDKPTDLGSTPEGYATISPLSGRAKVPGENLAERSLHLRAYFLEQYPLLAKDPAGLDALIDTLIGPANDFRGQLDITIYNTAATGYQQYAQIAAYLDTLPIRVEAINSLKRFYANKIINLGDRRYAVEGVKRTFAAISAQTRTVQIPSSDGPVELITLLWPDFANLSGTAKVRILSELSKNNPWLIHDMDKSLSQRDPTRQEVAGESGVNSSLSYHDTNLLRPQTDDNVSSKLQTRISITGQNDIAFEQDGSLKRAYFIATPGEWLLLPDNETLAAMAR